LVEIIKEFEQKFYRISTIVYFFNVNNKKISND